MSGTSRIGRGGISFALVLAAGLGSTLEVGAQAPAKNVPSVIVAAAVRKELTPTLTFTGRVEAIEKVELRARVDGYLEKRLFTEGGEVKAGDLLFVIEKAP